jgi:hypothetical protein
MIHEPSQWGGGLFAVPANIRIGCKSLPGTNTSFFVGNVRKRFITLGPAILVLDVTTISLKPFPASAGHA